MRLSGAARKVGETLQFARGNRQASGSNACTGISTRVHCSTPRCLRVDTAVLRIVESDAHRAKLVLFEQHHCPIPRFGILRPPPRESAQVAAACALICDNTDHGLIKIVVLQCIHNTLEPEGSVFLFPHTKICCSVGAQHEIKAIFSEARGSDSVPTARPFLELDAVLL